MAWTLLRNASRKPPHAWQPREKNAISVYRDSYAVGINTVRRKTQPSLGKRRLQAIKLPNWRAIELANSAQRTANSGLANNQTPVILSAAKDPNLTSGNAGARTGAITPSAARRSDQSRRLSEPAHNLRAAPLRQAQSQRPQMSPDLRAQLQTAVTSPAL